MNEISTAMPQKHRQLLSKCLFHTDEVVILRITAETTSRLRSKSEHLNFDKNGRSEFKKNLDIEF